MKSILLLDTSIGSSNLGDEIIMECVRKELAPLLENNFVYNLPTHLPAFNGLAVWRNSLSVQRYANCDMKFAGGSNLLCKNLLTHYPQWNISPFNSAPLKGVVTVGVGAGRGKKTNFYTKWLYRRILNQDFCHSVRDVRSKKFVESLGLKAINTGCVTMWKLTPDFCALIPTKKANRVVFTLTGRNAGEPADERDQNLVDIIRGCYDDVYFWPQGDDDYDYLHRLKNIEDVHVLQPTKDAYDGLLKTDDLDYVGTRLHGGVYAMRHGKRAIIVAIDERATAINESNHLNCIRRCDVANGLKQMILSEFSTKIKMPFDEIRQWKSQFGL